MNGTFGNSHGSLNEVDGEAWSGTLPEWRVADLQFMQMMARGDMTFRLTGPHLSETLQRFAKRAKGLEDARPLAQDISRYLRCLSTNPRGDRSWLGVVKLAFWTVRNAIVTWGYPIGETGVPLRDLRIEFWTPPNPKLKLSEDSLGLVMHPHVLLRAGATLIDSPKWFLDTRSLCYPDYQGDTRWMEVARDVASDYFRTVIFNQFRPLCLPDSIHPAVNSFLNGHRKYGNLFLGDGSTPGRLVQALMDNVKDKFDSLPEDAFLPWARTLSGLVPGPGSFDDWRTSREQK